MKKIHRFFVEPGAATKHRLSDPRVLHQVRNVLKLHAGEDIVLVDQGVENYVRIENITENEMEYTLLSREEKDTRALRSLTVGLSVLKQDRFEYAVQKLSELGVEKIIPLLSDRTIKTGIAKERLVRIATEAVELSGGTLVPLITDPISLSELLHHTGDLSWIVAEKGNEKAASFPSPCLLLVGPEGGWSEKEVDFFREKKCSWMDLGSRTLRAETAAIVGSFELLWR